MHVNGAFHSVEKSCGISIYILAVSRNIFLLTANTTLLILKMSAGKYNVETRTVAHYVRIIHKC